MKFEKHLIIFNEHLEERNLSERTVETYYYNTKNSCLGKSNERLRPRLPEISAKLQKQKERASFQQYPDLEADHSQKVLQLLGGAGPYPKESGIFSDTPSRRAKANPEYPHRERGDEHLGQS